MFIKQSYKINPKFNPQIGRNQTKIKQKCVRIGKKTTHDHFWGPSSPRRRPDAASGTKKTLKLPENVTKMSRKWSPKSSKIGPKNYEMMNRVSRWKLSRKVSQKRPKMGSQIDKIRRKIDVQIWYEFWSIFNAFLVDFGAWGSLGAPFSPPWGAPGALLRHLWPV